MKFFLFVFLGFFFLVRSIGHQAIPWACGHFCSSLVCLETHDYI